MERAFSPSVHNQPALCSGRVKSRRAEVPAQYLFFPLFLVCLLFCFVVFL